MSHILNVLNELKIKISIQENPYNFQLEDLFLMAARQNKKRSFLFVSTLLGKHIPVIPTLSLLTGNLLAHSYAKKEKCNEIAQAIKSKTNYKELYKNLQKDKIISDKKIIIGFAETATGFGLSVWESFANASYIHSTREELSIKPVIAFEEEHSHATSHKLYAKDENILNNKYEIILVDDEMTTGKTSINIIRELHQKFPRKKYTLMSILDWRSNADKKKFYDLEKDLDIHIETVSLFSGNFELIGKLDDNLTSKSPFQKINSQFSLHNLQHYAEKVIENIDPNNSSPFLDYTGRFGLESSALSEIEKYCSKITQYIKKYKKGQRTLLLGTEEFIYIPMKIASEVPNCHFHSTTISPIIPNNEKYYGVKHRREFQNNRGKKAFLYNIEDNNLDEIFILLERDYPRENLGSLIQTLQNIKVKNIHLLRLCSEKEIKQNPILGSYRAEDVIFLLKDLSQYDLEKETKEREEIIQNGGHYSEMLPIEFIPNQEYMDIFHATLHKNAQKLAYYVGQLAEKIIHYKKDPVLVSLARAGTPIGILLKKYIEQYYQKSIPHYSISIIRGKGIDENALFHIIEKHPEKTIQFVDGWTGKGAISKVLNEALDQFYQKYGIYLDNSLAVLIDSGHCSSIFGSREDFLIPSACLNSTISGLMSRTVLRDDLIGKNDFHGAKFHKDLYKEDLSQFFIDTIVEKFQPVDCTQIEYSKKEITWKGLKEIEKIQQKFSINDINLIKPGIGETTRVLLRRVPERILVKDMSHEDLQHIFALTQEKNVPVEKYKDMPYLCCGIISQVKK